MASKVLTLIICLCCYDTWGQKSLISKASMAIADSIAPLVGSEDAGNSITLWSELKRGSETHIGFGIASGYNNTRYLKISRRFKFENLPIGFYQTVEYATEYRYLGYEPTAPLFRMPFGISYEVSNKITLLTGTDIITKILYDYNGIRKDLGVCFDLVKTQITLGYSFVMGPSVMIRIPVL